MGAQNPLLFMEKFHICELSLACGLSCEGGVFGETLLLPHLHALTWPSYPLLWSSCSAGQVPFRGNCSTCDL